MDRTLYIATRNRANGLYYGRITAHLLDLYNVFRRTLYWLGGSVRVVSW